MKDNDFKEPIKNLYADCLLLIVKPQYLKKLCWDFIFNKQRISAKMEDEEMIKIIDNGEQFSKGDYMLVDLEVTEFYDPDLQTHLITKDSYKILKYKQHIKTPKQQRLF